LLAFGNVTGAMAFQATVPAIIGLCFTPWALSKVGFLAAGITVVGALIGLALTRDRGVDARILAPAGLGLFAIYVVAVVAGRF
jgi:cation:H+ antiporter